MCDVCSASEHRISEIKIFFMYMYLSHDVTLKCVYKVALISHFPVFLHTAVLIPVDSFHFWGLYLPCALTIDYVIIKVY